MKKILALSLALAMMLLAFVGCGTETTTDEGTKAAGDATEAATEAAVDVNAKSEGVLTYAEYAAKAVGETVVIEGYIQAKGDTYEKYGNSNIYLADKDGAYYVYRLTVNSADDWAKMTVGTKLKVTGVKNAWKDEVEIQGDDAATPATYEIVEGVTYTAEPVDVTDKVGTDAIANYQNQLITIKDAEVVASSNGAAFSYKWDGSGAQGDDAYFNVKIGETTYQFLVETDIADSSSDVYKAVEALKVGDKITLTGFAYWYSGLQMQVTGITK